MACLIFSTISFAKDIVLDVRTATEFQSAHTKNAINLDVTQDDFKNQILKFNKTDQYKIYCRSGHRAGNAVEIMKGLGFLRLENLGSLENAKKVLGE
jgi:phage shock protein E